MQIIQSKLLNKFPLITHGFTSKKNGNLAFHVGDTIENVIQNHLTLANDLHFDKNKLIHMKQIHSDIVKIVDKNDSFERPSTCDALITDKVNTPLMVMVADCSPILFFDPVQNVIAVAHAGRAGAFKNIVKKVCDCFTRDFDSKIENILVTVGASIKECCYEVGKEIQDEATRLELNDSISKKNDSYFLNIPKILKKQLLDEGVKKEHIEFSQECTCCSSDKYFSYRAQQVTGRFAGIIVLN